MGFISASGIGCAGRTAGSAILRIAAAAGCLATLPGATLVSTLEIDVVGLRSTKGLLQLCLTSDPHSFPDCRKGGNGVRRSVPATNSRIRLDGLPVGTYAAAIIHDANGNAKLDTTLGIPREGFGFSRNPTIGFGPPRFDAARFALGTDAQVQQVRMRYIL